MFKGGGGNIVYPNKHKVFTKEQRNIIPDMLIVELNVSDETINKKLYTKYLL